MLMLSFRQEVFLSKNWGFLSLIVLLALSSCGDSMRDVWSWLFRWPQTRNLRTHSSVSWNMFWTQTTPQWIINIALCKCCQHLLSTLVSDRENRLGLIEYNHSTGEFVQPVLLRLHVRANVCSLFMLLKRSDQPICIFLHKCVSNQINGPVCPFSWYLVQFFRLAQFSQTPIKVFH